MNKKLIHRVAPKIIREILRSVPFVGIVAKIAYVIHDNWNEPQPTRKQRHNV